MPAGYLHYLLLAAVGALFGTYGALIGAGGGFLIVPYLVLFQGIQPHQAAGTSLVAVFLNALSGSYSYGRQGRIDVRAGLVFAAATLPGAIVGGLAASRVSGATLRGAFGSLLLVMAVYLLWRVRPGSPQLKEGGGTQDLDRPRVFSWRLGVGLSLLIGFLSSFFGIGGGIIQVPAFVNLLGFQPHVATATSLFIMIFTAGAGCIVYAVERHILWGPALALGVGVIAGGQLGPKLAPHIQGRWLMRLLTLAVAAVGIRLLMG